MATCARRHASADVSARVAAHRRRPARSASRRDESGGRAAVDSLARAVDFVAVGARQRVLHGLSVHAAADDRSPLVFTKSALAAMAAEQVGRGRIARAIFVGLRGVFPLGQPVVDRVDRHRLLRRGAGDRRVVSRRGLLQVSVSDRAVQLRAVADVAVGNQGARTGTMYDLRDEGLHSRRQHSGHDRYTRMRTESLSAAQIGQHGLHILPRLRSRLPARQYRNSNCAPWQRTLARPAALRHRPVRPPPRFGGAGANSCVRRIRQCGRNGRTSRRMAAGVANSVAARVAAGDRQRVLFGGRLLCCHCYWSPARWQ